MSRPLRQGLISAAVLTIGAWVLIRLGSLPWLRVDWGDPGGWLARAEPDAALAALARMAGLVLAGWVGTSSVIYVVARLAGIRPGSIRWLSIGPIRQAVDALLAGSLLLGTVTPSLPAGAGVADTTTISTPAETVLPGYIPFPAGEIYPPPPPEHDNPPNTGSGPLPTAHHPIGAVPGVDTGAADEPATVVVRPGDNLWKLAARHLEQAGGGAVPIADIAPYWRRVVEVNRDRIRSGDPDLIYPGEKIVLPRISSGS
ncbi:MAG: LysM peptidoglycan-binding domain-containing protein [Acidimicrobiia bacterium]